MVLDKKKILIISGSLIGGLALGFLGYRIISRWNKEVIEDGNTTILVSKDEPTDVEVVPETDGIQKPFVREDFRVLPEQFYDSENYDLYLYETLSGMGDY